ncbi:MAG: hypothetical protein CBC83_01750 [Flavobacteriales bacterium TMED123]|nr:MAG: hypothetical protein CBC83_01750 [Flavobacteriales bacterium TMED123]|tara:strand:- start:2955 stop:3758 length:804 start_codon:yes stop_codon:yes gene_type:complete
MKRFVLILTLSFSYILATAQCTPLPYQDSLFNLWPDTVVNLPHVQQGINYSATITIKTPSTVIEAAGYDSSQTTVLGQYVGDWPVDSMALVSVNGMPAGLNLACLANNCVIPGDALSCAAITGTTNDPTGVYPLTIDIKLYTHGTITIIFPVPVDTVVTEQITGYKLVINNSTNQYELVHDDNFMVFQNSPNPFTRFSNIKFNSPKSDDIVFEVVDMFGRKVFTEKIIASKGINNYQLNHDFAAGIYMYSINNGSQIISKRMIVAEK